MVCVIHLEKSNSDICVHPSKDELGHLLKFLLHGEKCEQIIFSVHSITRRSCSFWHRRYKRVSVRIVTITLIWYRYRPYLMGWTIQVLSPGFALMRGSIQAKTNSCTKYFRKTLNHHSTLSLFLKATLSNDCTRVSEGFLPRLLKKGCDGQTNRRRRRESRR